MRYPASEKLEIIHLVEQSHLPIRQTLEKLGISRPNMAMLNGTLLLKQQIRCEELCFIQNKSPKTLLMDQ